MRYKSISLRLNLDDDSERLLYEKICKSAETYISMAAFLKTVLQAFYMNQELQSIQITLENKIDACKDEIQRVIQDEITRQGTLILSSLVSGSQSALSKVETSKNNLPDCSDKMPQELGGVLAMME